MHRQRVSPGVLFARVGDSCSSGKVNELVLWECGGQGSLSAPNLLPLLSSPPSSQAYLVQEKSILRKIWLKANSHQGWGCADARTHLPFLAMDSTKGPALNFPPTSKFTCKNHAGQRLLWSRCAEPEVASVPGCRGEAELPTGVPASLSLTCSGAEAGGAEGAWLAPRGCSRHSWPA